MKKYAFIALLLSTALFFTSCLKDKNIEDQLYGMKGLEDIKLIEFPQSPEKVFSLDYSTRDTSFGLITIRLNSAEPATEDIQVTLILDTSLIADYNDANGTSYEAAPASIYTLDNLTVTIPKGSREGSLTITTNPVALSAGEYALAFKIGQVSNSAYTVSKNYSSIITFIGVKNQYDGEYDVNVYLTHPSAAGDYEDEVHFATVDPKTVEAFLGVAGIFAATSKLYITVKEDNTLELSSNAVVIVPMGQNYYDPATKTFHFDYGWSGTRRIQGTAVRK